jgi:hypothetical protein
MERVMLFCAPGLDFIQTRQRILLHAAGQP